MRTLDHLQYIVIDLFCGAGGTTTGFELAEWTAEEKRSLGIPDNSKIAKVVACVNHDPIAIQSHWANHPDVEHFEEDITLLYHLPAFDRLKSIVQNYREWYPEAKVILWASLECTNFSKAKGGKPRDADSRTLADHLHPYINALNPDYVKIENVVEFMAWGPLDAKGKPVSRKNGTEWNRWRQSICALGYRDEWRELNSADFGALTSRNRLFGCFAKPGMPIVWPEPTHTKNPEKSMFKELKKWQPVKHALDFSDEGNSVFNRKKPLSTKTMQRLFMGCVKHVAGGKTAFMAKAYRGNPNHQSKSLDEPAGTLTTIPNQQNLVFITKWNSNDKKQGGHPGHSVEEPCPVVSTQNRLGAAFIVKGFSANSGKSVNAGSSIDQPAPTLTTQSRERLAFITRYNGVNGGKHDNSHSVEGPVGALGCGDNHAKVTANYISLYYSQGGQHTSIEEPAGTIPTKDRMAKVQAEFFIDKQFSTGEHNNQSVDQPTGSLMPVDKHCLIKAEKFLMDTNFNNVGKSLEEPAPTITADRHHHYLVNPSWGEGNTTGMEQPCPVVIARQDKAPLYLVACKEGPVAVPVYDDDCEWTIKLKEFMALYGIADIKMRMLKVPELMKIQGFPDNYVLKGNQSDQKKFIGNSVHPYVPEAWIKAPDYRQLKMAA
jgi:DNA (cytosine-5)-methyltransferase 1